MIIKLGYDIVFLICMDVLSFSRFFVFYLRLIWLGSHARGTWRQKTSDL